MKKFEKYLTVNCVCEDLFFMIIEEIQRLNDEALFINIFIFSTVICMCILYILRANIFIHIYTFEAPTLSNQKENYD